LKGEEAIAAAELFGMIADCIGEINIHLIDQQLFEAEGHERQR
jgi:hypothetical protein